jgi:phage tail sheath protein FI
MAEVLLSPGVLARENDQSFLTTQPVQAGAAILGPTVKGPVGIPTIVSTYSDYQNVFGARVTSGSAEYTYLTSISAYNYFQQGGDSLLVTRIASGSYTSATSSDITNGDAKSAFTLETLSEGVDQNSTSTEGSAGQLASGSADNIRWEITGVNSGSGTFALLIRQGNDITNNKSVLETWPNLTLDPNSSNYISKVIGDSKQTVATDGTESYLEYSGSYTNASRYVRVKEVLTPTLNFFDNAGAAKPEFTGSIPVTGSGSFGNAAGTPFGLTTRKANFYGEINNTDTQGLLGENYTTSVKLLANQDLYQYNLIVAPGLTRDMTTSGTAVLTSLVDNAQTRGDNLAIIDLKNYGSNIIPVTTKADDIDSSYAAAYWPWLQTVDPDLGSRVWVPASTMMPGVFAFNDRAGETWFAPAGLSRGGLTTVIRAERALTNGNRNTLYESNVNPIATFPNTGVVVFGQKTLQKRASALDRVNVRRLLISLKNFISQIADNLVFEQNTIATRNNFLSQVNPYLASVQQRQGLYAFKVVMDDSNNTPDVIDRNQLVGQIYIQPTKTAEFIYLDFNVLPTGATFPA